MRKIILLCLLTLFSCEKSIQKETNRSTDIIYAKSLIKNFYNDCDVRDYDKIYKNASADVNSTTIKRIISIKDSLGFSMKNYRIENVETFYTEIKNKDSITRKLEIHAFIKVDNDNNNTLSENLNFLKVNDESPKIVGYHIKG